MDLYKVGKIVSIGKTYIILESNYTGQIVYVARPSLFKKDKIRKVYIYNHHTEYSEAIYGFESFKERILFEDLISVSGIGPKTALNLLKEGHQNAINLISDGDAQKLAKFPSLGLKTANQLIFELKDKYVNMANKQAGKASAIDVKHSLKTLGFNAKQIDYAMSKLEPKPSIEIMVEEAIRLISNANFT